MATRYFRDERGRFRKWTEEEIHHVRQERILDEINNSDDELADIWNASVTEFIGDDPNAYEEFAFDNDGAELFRLGWAEGEVDTDERRDARAAFFELMEAYDISREEFDWDAWRDWYEDA